VRGYEVALSRVVVVAAGEREDTQTVVPVGGAVGLFPDRLPKVVLALGETLANARHGGLACRQRDILDGVETARHQAEVRVNHRPGVWIWIRAQKILENPLGALVLAERAETVREAASGVKQDPRFRSRPGFLQLLADPDEQVEDVVGVGGVAFPEKVRGRERSGSKSRGSKISARSVSDRPISAAGPSRARRFHDGRTANAEAGCSRSPNP